MKRIALLIGVVLILIFTLDGYIYQIKDVKFELLDTYSIDQSVLGPEVELVYDMENDIYNNLELGKFNVCLDKSTIAVSKRKIEKIKRMVLSKDFIEIYFSKDSSPDTLYVYVLPEGKFYFDERYPPKAYWHIP